MCVQTAVKCQIETNKRAIHEKEKSLEIISSDTEVRERQPEEERQILFTKTPQEQNKDKNLNQNSQEKLQDVMAEQGAESALVVEFTAPAQNTTDQDPIDRDHFPDTKPSQPSTQQPDETQLQLGETELRPENGDKEARTAFSLSKRDEKQQKLSSSSPPKRILTMNQFRAMGRRCAPTTSKSALRLLRNWALEFDPMGITVMEEDDQYYDTSDGDGVDYDEYVEERGKWGPSWQYKRGGRRREIIERAYSLHTDGSALERVIERERERVPGYAENLRRSQRSDSDIGGGEDNEMRRGTRLVVEANMPLEKDQRLFW